MNLYEKYQESYPQLASLRDFIENGAMLASVNFWRDSAQGYREFDIIENRAQFISQNDPYNENHFIFQFFNEEFPTSAQKVGPSEVSSIMSVIRDLEGEETYQLFKECVLKYVLEIAKASKEDWLSFIGLEDNISDKEAVFLQNLEVLLRCS